MDPFTQRMLERARARKEKLESKLPPSEQSARQRQPLRENNQSPHNVVSPSRDKNVIKSDDVQKKSEKCFTVNVPCDSNKSPLNIEDNDVAVKINIVHQNNVQVEVQVEEREVTLSEYLQEIESKKSFSSENNKISNGVNKTKCFDSDEQKENNTSGKSDKKADITEGVKTRLKKLGTLYSEEGVLSSPIHQSRDINLESENSNGSREPALSVPVNTSEKPRAKKFGRLAALAEEINTWEDDTSRHDYKPVDVKPVSAVDNLRKGIKTVGSSSVGSKSRVESSSSHFKPQEKKKEIKNRVSTPYKGSPYNSPSKLTPQKVEKPPSPSVTSPKIQSISTPKRSSISSPKRQSISTPKRQSISSPKPKADIPNIAVSEKRAPIPLSSILSPKKAIDKPAANVKSLASAIENKDNLPAKTASPIFSPKTGFNSKVKNSSPKPFQPHVVSSSPKKVNNWDKSILDDLESQGFQRQSKGRSRLVYNFEQRAEMAAACAPPAFERKPSLKKRPPPPPPPASAPAPAPAPGPPSSSSSTASSGYATPELRRDPLQLSVRDRRKLFETRESANTKKPVNITKPKIDSKPSNIAPVHNSCSREKTSALALTILSSENKTLAEKNILDKWSYEKNEDMKVIHNMFHKPDLDIIEHENPTEDISSESSPLMGNNSNHKSSTSNLGPKRPLVVHSPKIIINLPNGGDISDDVTDAVPISQQLKRSSVDSPLVVSALEDVKRIKVGPPKPGKLYPCLESGQQSEEEHQSCPASLDNSSDSAANEHADEDWGNTSFGREVLQAVGVKNTPNKSIINTPLAAGKKAHDSSDDSCCNVDDLLDEAFDFDDVDNDGPTPPKQNKNNNGIQTSDSFYYSKSYQANKTETDRFKSPMRTPRPKRLTEDINNSENKPLVHTVSFYRKQQNKEQQSTPVRIVRIECDEDDDERKAKEAKKAQEQAHESRKRVKELLEEVSKQNTVVLQASQALNLCISTIEFSGSTEQSEGERLLLIASHRRQACLNEIQRIQVEGVGAPSSHFCKLRLDELNLPLKREYVRQLNADGALGHYLVCLVKCQERVLATSMVKTVPESFTVTFPDKFHFDGLDADFKVTVEIYALQASKEILPHDIKYHIATKKSGKLTTPLKGTRGADLKSPLPTGSPGGPGVIRSPSMQLQGYCIFSAQQVDRTNFTLSKGSVGGPLEGCLRVKISCERRASQIPVDCTRRGFLTMFEETGGFGAWHRRWCVLFPGNMSYWRYPDDEKKKTPMGSIDLSTAMSETVGPAPRDLCARPHTLLLETSIDPSLYSQPRGESASSLIIVNNRRRHLLAADTRPERDAWATSLNESLKCIKDVMEIYK